MALKSLCVLALAYLAIGVEGATCTKDRCYYQVSSNRFAQPASARFSGCTSFLRKTVTPAIVTATFTAQGSNTIRPNTAACPTTHAGPSQVPRYASACANRRSYASACGCFGISARTTTIAPCTTTIVVTPTSKSSSIRITTSSTTSSSTKSASSGVATSSSSASASSTKTSSSTPTTSTTKSSSSTTSSATTSGTASPTSTKISTSVSSSTSTTGSSSTTSSSTTSSTSSALSTSSTSSSISTSSVSTVSSSSTTSSSSSATSSSPIITVSPGTATSTSSSTVSLTSTGSSNSRFLPAPTSCSNQGLTWAYFTEHQAFDSFSGYASYHPENSNIENPNFVSSVRDTEPLDFAASATIGSFYRQYDAPSKQYTVNQQGYIYAPMDGVYTFTALNTQGFIALWLGASAYAGWDRSNDVLESYDLGGAPGASSYQTQLTGGTYYPFRYVFAQSTGATSMSLQILAPDGSDLFPQDSISPYLVRHSCDSAEAPEHIAFGSNYQARLRRCTSANGCLDNYDNCIAPGCFGNSGCVPLGQAGCNKPIGFS